jgi:4-hydroxybenzoate polyprenyltransferase
MFRNRSTADVVVIILAMVVPIVIVMAIIAVFITEFFHPDAKTSNVIDAISSIVSTVTGAVLGYLAGRKNTPTEVSTTP